jgi:ABC-type multidrug transport system fused ATPase/permease subunit
MIKALFRLLHIERRPTSAIELDSIDISQVEMGKIRRAIGYLSKEPILFSGTLRDNLDPSYHHKDYELWDVLEKIGLKEAVKNNLGGLETEIEANVLVGGRGKKSSDGIIPKIKLDRVQLQLIGIAREILKKPKILVYEEDMLSDKEAENYIDSLIKKYFQESTILCILHKLENLGNFDRVVIMEKGKIIEVGCPLKLLAKRFGDDYITNEESFLAQAILATGKETSEKLFNVIKERVLNKESI